MADPTSRTRSGINVDLSTHAIEQVSGVMRRTLGLCETQEQQAALAFVVMGAGVSYANQVIAEAIPEWRQQSELTQLTALVSAIMTHTLEGPSEETLRRSNAIAPHIMKRLYAIIKQEFGDARQRQAR